MAGVELLLQRLCGPVYGDPGVSGSPRQALAGRDLGPGCHLVNIWEGRKRLSGRDGFLKGPGVGGGFQRDKAGRGSLIA